ncbi:MAG: C1 family peptidase [Endozoicomonas sp.]
MKAHPITTGIAFLLATFSLAIFSIVLQAHPLSSDEAQLKKIDVGSYDYLDEDSAYRLFLQNFRHPSQQPDAQTFETRKKIFQKNLKYIKALNERSTEQGKDATAGINNLADLSREEYLKRLGVIPIPPTHDCKKSDYPDNFTVNRQYLPAKLDWREKGAVTAVKDQGQCGSCWAFGATGAIEACHYLNNGTLVSLSEQQILDCNEQHFGCKGGRPIFAYEYVIRTKGLCRENSDPYVPQDEPCRGKDLNCQRIAHISSYKQLPEGNDDSLIDAVQLRTIAVAIDASKDSFQFYTRGVYYEPTCSKIKLDHAVLVIGYGTSDSGKEYWLVKNSWGESWGQDGYIWMDRSTDNLCGISTQASYPIH